MNVALLIAQIDYWLGVKGGVERDGQHWVWKTVRDWQRDLIHVGSADSWGRVIRAAESTGIVITKRQPRGKLYTLDMSPLMGLEPYDGADRYDHRMYAGFYPAKSNDSTDV